MLQPRIVGVEHYGIAQRVKQTSQRYKELQDIIAILGLDELSEDDRFARARKIEPETIRGFQLILSGELDAPPESEIILSTYSGQIGVLPNHTPIARAVDIGILRLRLNDQWLKVTPMGGFARVGNNYRGRILSDIDPQEAQQALETAKANLSREGKRQAIEANLAVRRAIY
ncbi:hypothetical protein MKW94_001892 [Papaver nudicaule]|uniref:ATP synthase epsilon chain, chloroplastic n=1 Tax=Papaver nudicaule TaxID=74823 RepID=A0AA41VE22_PAPNU|nr:hypothetical protein [Papaver nudicaule]